MFYKLVIILVIFFILVCSFTLLFNFDYINLMNSFKFDSLFFEKLNFVMLFFSGFLALVLGEYFLRNKIEFKKSFYFLSIPFSIFVVLIVDFTEWIFISFLVGCSDWCGIQLFYYPIYIFPISLVYWLARIDKLRLSEHNFTDYLIVNFLKIMKISFFVIFLIFPIIFFDYFTEGRFLKISNKSNINYWLSEAVKNNDVKYCDFIESKEFGENTNFCYKSFFKDYKIEDFREYKNSNNNKNLQDIYDYLKENNCVDLEEERYFYYCEEAILSSIRDEFRKDLFKNVDIKFKKYISSDIYMGTMNGWYGTIIVKLNGNSFENSDSKFQFMKNNLVQRDYDVSFDNNLDGDIYVIFSGRHKDFDFIYSFLNKSVLPVLLLN